MESDTLIAVKSTRQPGAQRTVLNMGFLLITRIVAMVCSLAFVVIVTRKWGPSGYGQYALVLTFISYFAFLSGFGLDRVVIQRVAAEGNERVYFFNSLAARLGLSCLAILAVIIFLRVLNETDLVIPTIIASGSLMANSLYQAASALLQARERMDILALLELPFAISCSALGLAVVLVGYGLVPLFTVYLLVDALQAVIGLVICMRVFHLNLEWPTLSSIFGLIRNGAPLALWILSSAIEFRMGFIVLSQYWGNTVVGLYAAPFKVVDVISLTTLAMMGALLPTFSRLFAQSPKAFARAYGVAWRLILIVFLPVTIGTTVLAKPMVILVFGSNFLASTQSLQLLVWGAFAMSLQFLGGTALLAVGKWGRIPLLGIIVDALALLAAFLLIPTWGSVGAALALLITETVNACGTFFLVWHYSHVWPEVRGLGRLGISLASWGTLVWIVRGVNVLLVLVCAIPLYIFLVFVCKAIKPSDLELAKPFIPQRIYSRFFSKPAILNNDH